MIRLPNPQLLAISLKAFLFWKKPKLVIDCLSTHLTQSSRELRQREREAIENTWKKKVSKITYSHEIK